jgi:hypothetical protein
MKDSTALRLVCRKPAGPTEIRFAVPFMMEAQGKVLEAHLLGMMGQLAAIFWVVVQVLTQKRTSGL